MAQGAAAGCLPVGCSASAHGVLHNELKRAVASYHACASLFPAGPCWCCV
jgi:hypothetical protein